MQIGETLEIEDGIHARKNQHNTCFLNDYSKNQFKFMPTAEEMNLFSVIISCFFFTFSTIK